MPIAVGVDVAKDVHWAEIKIAETGKVLVSRRVDNTPDVIAELIDQIRDAETGHGPATVGIDILGGIASLLEAMLLDAGLAVVHVPGLAVNRARRGTTGGEHKSDPKDAKVIADQVRMRDDLRPVTAMREDDVELRLLVGRRTELVTDATRRANRLRELPASVHPGLERQVDVTGKTGLHLLTRYVTPAEIRTVGRARLLTHLRKLKHVKDAFLIALAEGAVDSARAQRVSTPGETVAADLVRDIAAEALAAKERLAELDKRITRALDRHPDAALIRSLPGMGATLTAEFLAVTGGIGRFATGDRLAAAAGLAPVLKQSGKVRYLQRAHAGDKALKRVFYQSAFIAVGCDPTSKTFYQRKRAEGKSHHQAVLALARRRVNVLHAILRNRMPYEPGYTAAAA
ncbi:IS110 family transposase [Actinomadura bangladeshensis]|uniref:IS110 family transposase n=1 Tax=Actinomadura bangladeshensis TaxID=453573 RepID=A0A6L9QWZ0_9ACTN|nr:IS110 family transposase [Actinomadura bangladeshensis]NEA29472.1 IS110 family transposase [Actinomadura bangladeshensis]